MMASDDRRHALLLLVILLHSPELAAASPCVDDLFIPLVVYFFVTIALGAAGAVYVLVRRHPTLHSGDAPDDAHKGGSVIFDADIDDAGRGEATGRQSWEIKFSELRFGRCIGVGNVGEVYKGMFRGRTVAIKKLLGSWLKDDDMVARFKDEILLMSTMNHTNVLSFYGAVLDREAGQICLVMELCERGTLEELLRSPREPLSWLRRLKMARAIALGMDYVHSKAGIIQRDLKAANLLVTREYDVKIADFGLSRSMRSGAMETYCGTPAYMAPEIVRQEAYSEKADVFSYGIILWELLTRQEPYAGETSGLSLAYAVANEGLRPPLPAYCPREWASLMLRSWSSNPAIRPSFDAIHRELFVLIRVLEIGLSSPVRRTLGLQPYISEDAADIVRRADAADAEAALRATMTKQTKLAAGAAGGPPKAPLPWMNPGVVFVET